MCKANQNIETKVNELMELKKMAEDLNAEIEAIQDEIKAFMEAENAENMSAGSYIVSFKEVVTKRCDTKALRQLLGDALDPYMKSVISKRFTVR